MTPFDFVVRFGCSLAKLIWTILKFQPQIVITEVLQRLFSVSRITGELPTINVWSTVRQCWSVGYGHLL